MRDRQDEEGLPTMIISKPKSAVFPAKVMDDIYSKIRTPFKYGIILRGEEGERIDSPSVFRHGDMWYMMYAIYTKGRGYETALAESNDLLEWRKLGRILPFRDGAWDTHQAAGYIALQDHEWGGSHKLLQHDGKYWLSYIGGDTRGYEAGRLSIGVGWTDDPSEARSWERLDHPVLSPDQPDVREFENDKLYKSHIIRDDSESLGFPYVMYYNARGKYESIGMAVSDNMVDWHRYGAGPVIDNSSGISGDPQIARIGDVWVMFYFGCGWKPDIFDTFACSYNLVSWTKWDGPHLTEPSEPWDSVTANKPWVIFHDGVVYHFYHSRCGAMDSPTENAIAVATSKDLRADWSSSNH
jgi:predicted GH43/DUF377 family glycosyl hydrolase